MRNGCGLVFVLFIAVFQFEFVVSKNTHHRAAHINATTMANDEDSLNHHQYGNSSLGNAYTDWTKWSRCIDCLQRRMKTCISPNCRHNNSRMYEERECHKRRCARKQKRKISSFHVVHLNASSSYLTKQAPSDVWSKWSKWQDCSRNCLTYRTRRCKKPGRCKKDRQTQNAYCYRERTGCEALVLELLETKERQANDRRYHYSYYNNQYMAREAKTKEKCGMTFSKPQMLKIIGGVEAQKYKWPWHVALLNRQEEVFCGGTLIASRWVLTANHCIRRDLRVRLNAHDLRARDGRDIEMVVHKVFEHPRFELQTVDNDIALLMLPRRVRTPVACLPNKRPKAGQLCSVMGWGKLKTSDDYGVNVLREAKLPLVAHKMCKRSYKDFLISDNMMCAGWKSGKSDTCAGDSGGGLMCPNKRKSEKPIYSIQGITSFGDGCGGRNKFGIYTAVFNYNNWIRHIIDHYS